LKSHGQFVDINTLKIEMTWSLQIRNGDLTLAAAHYGTVTGEQKLVQDFRAYLLERMGTDDMHPDYGSLLDGGRLPSGRSVQGIIGETDPDIAELTISTEIKRIANEYQARQLERAKEDRQIYDARGGPPKRGQNRLCTGHGRSSNHSGIKYGD
jgi:hypothetical protein